MEYYYPPLVIKYYVEPGNATISGGGCNDQAFSLVGFDSPPRNKKSKTVNDMEGQFLKNTKTLRGYLRRGDAEMIARESGICLRTLYTALKRESLDDMSRSEMAGYTAFVNVAERRKAEAAQLVKRIENLAQ